MNNVGVIVGERLYKILIELCKQHCEDLFFFSLNTLSEQIHSELILHRITIAYIALWYL